MPELVVVLAGSHAQFRLWCRSAGLDPRSRHLVYARDARVLYGLRGFRVVRCGTWWLRRDLREVEQVIRAREMASATPDPVASQSVPS
jgi:hypothetical protein